jgi:hypothetical protein
MPFDLASLPAVWQKAILNGPALQPPPGVQPNFINPENQNSLGLALIVMCAVVSTVMTGTRLYAKLIGQKRLGIEDCESSCNLFNRPELIFERSFAGSFRRLRRLPLHLIQDCITARSLRPSMERQTERPLYHNLRKSHISARSNRAASNHPRT